MSSHWPRRFDIGQEPSFVAALESVSNEMAHAWKRIP